MRALQIATFGDPAEVVQLVEIPEPDDPRASEVLVAVEYTPINTSALLLIRGIYGVRPALPTGVGNEGVGPHSLHQFLLADQPSRVLHQVLEGFIYLRAKLDLLSRLEQTSPRDVQRELAELIVQGDSSSSVLPFPQNQAACSS